MTIVEALTKRTEDIVFREATLSVTVNAQLIPIWLGAIWQMDGRAAERRRALIDFTIERTLTDDNGRVRAAAASALLNEPKAADVILSRLSDASETTEVRAAACDALAVLGVGQARPVLLEIITHPEVAKALRVRATLALSELVDDDTAALLEERILTGTETTAVSAVMALSTAGRHDVLDRLATMCLMAPRFDAQAQRGIEALGWATQVTGGALDRLMSVSLGAKREMTGIAAAIRAHAIAPEKTLSVLATTLTDPATSPDVRERSAIALAFIQSDAATRTLQELRNKSDVLPHVKATAGLAVAFADAVRKNDEAPSRLEWLTMRLNFHMEAGSWEQALSDCTEIITASTDNHSFYRLRSVCLVALHRLSQALDDALKAKELNPNDVENHKQVASVYDEAGQYPEAVAAATDAVQIDQNDGYAWLMLGWYFYEAGNIAESIDASRRAALLLPDEPAALLNAGLALLVQNDADAACKEYDSAVQVTVRSNVEDARAILSSGLSDLNSLLTKRPDLSLAAEACIAKLRHACAEMPLQSC